MTATDRIENKEKRISQPNNKISSVRIRKGAELVNCQQYVHPNVCRGQFIYQKVNENIRERKYSI